jgi:hypothetical protein
MQVHAHVHAVTPPDTLITYSDNAFRSPYLRIFVCMYFHSICSVPPPSLPPLFPACLCLSPSLSTESSLPLSKPVLRHDAAHVDTRCGARLNGLASHSSARGPRHINRRVGCIPEECLWWRCILPRSTPGRTNSGSRI